MSRFTGEYQSTVDDKGRVKLPAGLIRQMEEQGMVLNFVINRGFEKCLMLYPRPIWDLKAAEVDKLNIYDPVQRQFVRYFYRGATQILADPADRLLLPKNLTEYAGLEKNVILFAYLNQIEIWDQKKYNAELANEPDQFSELAANVFGRIQPVSSIPNGI